MNELAVRGLPEHAVRELVWSYRLLEHPSLAARLSDVIASPIQPDDSSLFFINPEGPVIGGGPAAHSGLIGRKTGT